MKRNIPWTVAVTALMAAAALPVQAAPTGGLLTGLAYRSAPPMRPLPVAFKAPLAAGPRLFVDVARGSDTNAGNQQAPWKTIAFGLRHVKAGDTLYLRGGTYYEKISLSQSGTEQAPITVSSYPGELAVIDGGLREFAESPATAWQPFAGGAPDEFVSTASYSQADARRVPSYSLPNSFEALLDQDDTRPLALGNFADSMVPLHGYRTASDFRAANELWVETKDDIHGPGIYAGPGLWFDRETGRIHIRLTHNQLAGLGDHAYRGETDPRKLPLVIAAGFGDEVLRINGVKNVRVQGLVLRGATGSALINVYAAQNIALDHLTVYGGSPAMLVNVSKDIHVTNSAFRGLAAPWISRAHMKYRGTAAYQLIFQSQQPVNENIEFASCEFTDGHDFAYFRYAKNLRFHHNFVDNFNDDGIECGPRLYAHSFYLYQNRFGRILLPLSQHETSPDDSPTEYVPGSGVYAYRNVYDLRGGTYKFPPAKPVANDAFLHEEGHVIADHGSPVWPLLRFYQNTVVRDLPANRDAFLMGIAMQGTASSERDVFNNILVQMNGVPGVGLVAVKKAENLREGGNLIWGVKEGPVFKGDAFAKFRASALFTESRQKYPEGWTTQDQFADPKFTRLSVGDAGAPDLRLQPGSPAINAGQSVPADWPDPLRETDAGAPDSGAVPLGAAPWGIGIDGRLSLFGAER